MRFYSSQPFHSARDQKLDEQNGTNNRFKTWSIYILVFRVQRQSVSGIRWRGSMGLSSGELWERGDFQSLEKNHTKKSTPTLSVGLESSSSPSPPLDTSFRWLSPSSSSSYHNPSFTNRSHFFGSAYIYTTKKCTRARQSVMQQIGWPDRSENLPPSAATDAQPRRGETSKKNNNNQPFNHKYWMQKQFFTFSTIPLASPDKSCFIGKPGKGFRLLASVQSFFFIEFSPSCGQIISGGSIFINISNLIGLFKFAALSPLHSFKNFAPSKVCLCPSILINLII